MTVSLAKIKIVLVETSHPGNIGAVARAMKNMSMANLCLINPKVFPSADATARASGADDILASAKVYQTLSEAMPIASWCLAPVPVAARLAGRKCHHGNVRRKS